MRRVGGHTCRISKTKEWEDEGGVGGAPLSDCGSNLENRFEGTDTKGVAARGPRWDLDMALSVLLSVGHTLSSKCFFCIGVVLHAV